MRLRSLLFVPGDRPERFPKAAATGADALILDLEDAVSLSQKDAARAAIREALAAKQGGPLLFVRVNPLDSALVEADLDALKGTKPDAIVLPKAEGAASITELGRRLASRGLTSTPVFPIATETPAAVFVLGSFRDVSRSLVGLTWGAEDLPAAIGATTAREEDGRYTPPYEIARAMTLFAAHAAGVLAVDTVYPAFKDLDGLARYAARAARDGFSGMMAIHPSQVAVINAAFTPSAEALAHARTIVAAFEASPGAGVLQIEGKMVDAPHLKQAKRILSQVDEAN